MFKRFRQGDQGQAVVELALVAPILLMILFGIIEFGRIYNAYLIIDHATRSAARVGVTGASDATIESKVKSLSTTLPNSTQLAVYIYPVASNRVRGNDLIVVTKYPFKFIAPLLGTILGNPLTLSSDVVMRIE